MSALSHTRVIKVTYRIFHFLAYCEQNRTTRGYPHKGASNSQGPADPITPFRKLSQIAPCVGSPPTTRTIYLELVKYRFEPRLRRDLRRQNDLLRTRDGYVFSTLAPFGLGWRYHGAKMRRCTHLGDSNFILTSQLGPGIEPGSALSPNTLRVTDLLCDMSSDWKASKPCPYGTVTHSLA